MTQRNAQARVALYRMDEWLLFDLFAGVQVVQIVRDEVVLERRLGKLDPGAKIVVTLLRLDEALFTTVRPKSQPDREEIPRM